MRYPKLLAQINEIRTCATKAGVDIFAGYGTCLGLVRDGTFVEGDGDADLCVLADKITAEQEAQFFRNLQKANMFRARKEIAIRNDTKRLLWLSVMRESDGVKTCIWFQQRHFGYYWHGKGYLWVEKIGPYLKPSVTKAQAIFKGIPEELFDNFKDAGKEFRWKIPARYGEILDMWYPCWHKPIPGFVSLCQNYLIVQDWNSPKTWAIRKI
jgi:hypothetical protein